MGSEEAVVTSWSADYENALRRHLPQAEGRVLTSEDKLVSLGLDSLEAVQLLIDLEADCAIEFPDEALTAEVFATVGSLWAEVSRQIEEQGTALNAR